MVKQLKSSFKRTLKLQRNQTMSKDIKDLVSLIDMRGLECLNEQTGHSIKNAIEEVEISKFSFIAPAKSEFNYFVCI